MTEQWKELPSGNGKYIVSSEGRVARLQGGRICNVGYYMTNISAQPRQPKFRLLHALVAETFLGARPEGCHINHKDGCKTNNCAENLEYISRKENIRHAYRLGLVPVGAQHPHAKLSEADVIAIRLMAGACSQAKLAKIYGIAQTTLSAIVRNETYRTVHVSPENLEAVRFYGQIGTF